MRPRAESRKVDLPIIEFTDLEESELAREATLERIDRFRNLVPDLDTSQLRVRLGLHRSASEQAPDMFQIDMIFRRPSSGDQNLRVSAPNFFDALERLEREFENFIFRARDRKTGECF